MQPSYLSVSFIESQTRIPADSGLLTRTLSHLLRISRPSIGGATTIDSAEKIFGLE